MRNYKLSLFNKRTLPHQITDILKLQYVFLPWKSNLQWKKSFFLSEMCILINQGQGFKEFHLYFQSSSGLLGKIEPIDWTSILCRIVQTRRLGCDQRWWYSQTTDWSNHGCRHCQIEKSSSLDYDYESILCSICRLADHYFFTLTFLNVFTCNLHNNNAIDE